MNETGREPWDGGPNEEGGPETEIGLRASLCGRWIVSNQRARGAETGPEPLTFSLTELKSHSTSCSLGIRRSRSSSLCLKRASLASW